MINLKIRLINYIIKVFYFQDVIIYNITKQSNIVFCLILKHRLYENHIQNRSCRYGKQHLSFPEVKCNNYCKGNELGYAMAASEDVYTF